MRRGFLFAALALGASLVPGAAASAKPHSYYGRCSRSCQIEIVVNGSRVTDVGLSSKECGSFDGKGGRIRHGSFRFKSRPDPILSPENHHMTISGKRLTAKGVDVRMHAFNTGPGACDLKKRLHLKRYNYSPLDFY